MAINPELITTIRVDQLPDGTLNLTNKIPHTSGTVLEKASVQDLVDLVATAIGVSGGVGYIALSVTDGQQLPDVPELPSFFLCGAGTFLNINGYPDIICTENLNAIMSLTDHWELAVEIPINPLSGTVQSVTGSAVDNTDPLNPVINSTGGVTPTLQEVLDNNHDLVDGNNFQGSFAGDNNTGIFVNAFGQDAANTNTGTQVNALGTESAIQNEGGNVNAFGNVAAGFNTGNEINALGDNAGYENTANHVNAMGYAAGLNNTFNNVNLFGASATADENGQTVLSKDGSIMARISTTDLTATRKYTLPDADGTLALTTDIPTLQDVTDEGNTTTNDVKVNSLGLYSNSEANYGYLSWEGDTGLSFKNNATQEVFKADKVASSLSFVNNDDFIAKLDATLLTDNRTFLLPDADGTLALTSDIPTGSGGIPHATASGTDTYTATITGVAAYADGDAYLIRFTNGNTTGATLNINSLGAITLYRNNDGVLIGGDIISGGEMICVYNSATTSFQVIGTSPNSLFAYVTNADSVTLTKGMPVYAFSGTGDRMTVKRAYNTLDATSAQTVGLVLSTSIAANQKGLIMMQGLLDGLSILPTSTFADGDPVYLGATAGTITKVKPYAPNHLVYLGVVTTANNGSAGRMYVRIQNGYELDELHNVQAQSPTLKDTLWYDNTVSPAQWKTASIATILGFTAENVANKENTTLDTSTTKYPTNRLTKEYADSKVTDAITDGVTTTAPSQNAVFDALALKQNSLGYTPYRNVQTSQTAITATVAETIVFTATIPAGSFSSNDILKMLFGVNKLNSLAGYTLRIRLNTTNTISGSTVIALYTGSSTPQLNIIMRNFNLNGGNLYGFLFSTSALTDIAATAGALNSTTLNPANTFYLFATVQLTGLTDSIIGNMFTIHN